MMDNGGTDEARRWTCIESKRIETADSVFQLFNAGMFNARWLSQQAALYFIQNAALFWNAIHILSCLFWLISIQAILNSGSSY